MEAWIEAHPWVIAVIFPLFWSLIIGTMGVLGGWNAVARLYPGDYVPQGRRFNFRSVTIRGFVNYDNAINTIVAAEGIYLRPMVIFRINHLPILLPWSLLQTIEHWGTVRKQLQLTFQIDGKSFRVRLPLEAEAQVRQYAPRSIAKKIESDEQLQVRA